MYLISRYLDMMEMNHFLDQLEIHQNDTFYEVIYVDHHKLTLALLVSLKNAGELERVISWAPKGGLSIPLFWHLYMLVLGS